MIFLSFYTLFVVGWMKTFNSPYVFIMVGNLRIIHSGMMGKIKKHEDYNHNHRLEATLECH